MSARTDIHYLLYQLAQFYGVQAAYYDMFHRRRQASTESLLALLGSLGVPVVTIQDVPLAWREQQQTLWQRLLEPVFVAWDGEPSAIIIRLPVSADETALRCCLELETGEEMHWQWRNSDLEVMEVAEIEGVKYAAKRLPLPGGLPWGYHRLVVELPQKQVDSLLISAPVRAYTPPGGVRERSWGVFLPLYSLRSQRNWGSGDFSDLAALADWVGGMNGNIVATLPLLATFLDDTFEPSPYLPVSRLLWNEFYLDITKAPELPKCPAARTLLASSVFENEINYLRSSPLVDYQRHMALKRKVLAELSDCLFADKSRRFESLQRFVEANPVVEDYARFRAAGEKQRAPWQSWPQPLREGVINDGDYNEEDRRYHVYVQWLAYQQMESVSAMAREKGVQLYLDLPLGVHPHGYDLWREQDVFLQDTSVGAAPDNFSSEGQDWGFPPLHPEKIREQGYRYIIAYLRHHFRQAGILRIDHVMGLHRLFCIPDSMDAHQGVYLRYHAEELYAILTLESHRNQTVIVGEDLGTVPPYVRPALKKHNLNRMYVLPYELASRRRGGPSSISSNAVASMNTHDMPPFAAFWRGLDIEGRVRFGLLDEGEVKREKKNLANMKKALVTFLQNGSWLREQRDGIAAIFKACLSFLAASQARLVLVNLEDLWLEIQPQNVPGTVTEHPNWQRKARYSFEEFCQMPQVTDTLRMVNMVRKGVVDGEREKSKDKINKSP
ncbi:MAG: 4-alpha-glucanotransferase [Chloroflexi bacterium]|nr:4-alpha-glucanotransferase [Chloroflexota bacterium]